jgi:hypothetical protein
LLAQRFGIIEERFGLGYFNSPREPLLNSSTAGPFTSNHCANPQRSAQSEAEFSFSLNKILEIIIQIYACAAAFVKSAASLLPAQKNLKISVNLAVVCPRNGQV